MWLGIVEIKDKPFTNIYCKILPFWIQLHELLQTHELNRNIKSSYFIKHDLYIPELMKQSHFYEAELFITYCWS